MSKPVVYMLQDEDDVEFNTMNMFSCGRTGGIPLYLTPDPRVAELEAVLRECREAMQKAKYSGTPYTSSYNRAITKIDEVLK